MDVKGKTVSVLVGRGLIVQAIGGILAPEKPGKIVGCAFEGEESGFRLK